MTQGCRDLKSQPEDLAPAAPPPPPPPPQQTDRPQNQLSSKLPSSIGVSLPNLEGLYLGENDLSGIVPDSILNASKLVILVLSSNRFNGSIPSSLGNLRLLDYLYLLGNNFTCEYSFSSELNFLTSLSSCRQLRKLVISSNSLNGILPASIGNLSNSLDNIDASYCGIKGNIPSEIANLSNLAFFLKYRWQ
ncbi:hypothetical protein ACSBR1_014521 [Camellia fascicularis]